jgi:pilus assembly protein CpaC
VKPRLLLAGLLGGLLFAAPLAAAQAPDATATVVRPHLPPPLPLRKQLVLPRQKPLAQAAALHLAAVAHARPLRPGVELAVMNVPTPAQPAAEAIPAQAPPVPLAPPPAAAPPPPPEAAPPMSSPVPLAAIAPKVRPVPQPQPTRALSLDLNKSQMLHLGRKARDVLVANPAIADVVLRSADTAFIIGKKIGETNVYFFDAENHQIDQVDVSVTFDSAAVVAALKRTIPNEEIGVSTANETVVLTGNVANQQAAENARQIAQQFMPKDIPIINLLNIRDRNQVLLRVRVTEMSRQTVKELGIVPGFPIPFQFNVGGTNFTLSGAAPGFVQSPYAALASGLSQATGLQASTHFSALLQALESNGIVKTLAEPNLTAVSGETASFLVGGEFPVPAPQASGSGTTNVITVTYKDFGIQLTFTPVVLSSGLINLRVATEVSQLSTQGQITESGFNIPALSVRRAETTVEIPSGGSIAIAGLLQSDIQNTIQGLPGLKDLPILGALFSSKQFQRQETDLVIAVTPVLVRAVDPASIAFPTDGFGPASDFNMYFLGRLHATYAPPTPSAPHGQPKGPFGFILE